MLTLAKLSCSGLFSSSYLACVLLLYVYVAKNAEGGKQNEIRFVRELARLRIVSLAIIFMVSLLVSLFFGVAYALVPILVFVPVLFVVELGQ